MSDTLLFYAPRQFQPFACGLHVRVRLRVVFASKAGRDPLLIYVERKQV